MSATIETDQGIFARFDLSGAVLITEGEGRFSLDIKGSALPLFALDLDVARIYVVHFKDPRYSVSVQRGDPLPNEARPYVMGQLSLDELERLSIHFETRETHP